jgi:FeS assembly SUF system regulator
MIRMTRLTDYAVALLAQFAVAPGQHSAREMAAALRLPVPAVSKVLKLLARGGLLTTHRGVKGGFALARRASDISVADVLRAFDGPLALTECSSDHGGGCELEGCCTVSGSWKRINRAVEDALDEISISEMVSAPAGGFDGIKDAVRACVAPGTLRV